MQSDGDAAVVAGEFGPVAARQLFALEKGDAVVDGGENLGGVDGPLFGGLRRLRECGRWRYNRYDRQGRNADQPSVKSHLTSFASGAARHL